MGVDNSGQIFAGTLELHCDHAFRDQLRGIGAQDVHTQDFVCFCIREHFDQPARVSACQGSAICGERKRACFVVAAGSLEFLLCLANPGNFRFRIDHPGHGVKMDMGRFAGDQFGNCHTFFGSLVRQHRAAHAVTNGPDAGSGGPGLVVDFDLARIRKLHTRAFIQQAFGVGLAADTDQQAVEDQLAFTILVFQGDGHLAVLNRSTFDQGAEADVQPLFLEFSRGLLTDILVCHRQEILQRFQQDDFGTQPIPHRAQFQADDTCADHAQRRGY